MYEYSAELIRDVDGDTVELMVSLGFGIYSQHSVRLRGVNAPEKKTADGKSAMAWTAQWLSDNSGPYVLTTRKGDETEKYGRYLAYLKSSVTGRILNDDIVAAGHAVVYMI